MTVSSVHFNNGSAFYATEDSASTHQHTFASALTKTSDKEESYEHCTSNIITGRVSGVLAGALTFGIVGGRLFKVPGAIGGAILGGIGGAFFGDAIAKDYNSGNRYIIGPNGIILPVDSDDSAICE